MYSKFIFYSTKMVTFMSYVLFDLLKSLNFIISNKLVTRVNATSCYFCTQEFIGTNACILINHLPMLHGDYDALIQNYLETYCVIKMLKQVPINLQ